MARRSINDVVAKKGLLASIKRLWKKLLFVWKTVGVLIIHKIFSRKISDNKDRPKSVIQSEGGRSDLAILAIFLFITLLMTYPLVKDIANFVPGIGNDNGDTFIFLWNAWWLKKAAGGGAELFFTDFLFWPNGVSLVFHTFNLFNTVLISLLSEMLGLVRAFNIVYLFSLWLSASFTYFLVKEVWKSRLAGLVAGVIFAFSPFVWAHSLGHFNLVTIWPFAALMWLFYRIYRLKNWKEAIGAGILLSLILYNDYQYFVYAIILSVMFIVYYQFFGEKKKFKEWYLSWIVVVVVVLIMIFPMFWRGWSVFREFAPTALLSEVKYWSADLMSFVTPSWQHPIWGQWGLEINQQYFASKTESVLFVGYGVLLLFVISVIIFLIGKKKTDFIFWFGVALIFGLLSLGPILKIYGIDEFSINDINYNIALPYLWLYKLPFWAVARVPARFFAVMILAVAVIASYVVARLDRKMPNYKVGRYAVYCLVLLVVVEIIFEYSAWPLSLQKISIPPVYNAIKDDQQNVAILELPLWWTSGHRSMGEVKTIIQFYQTYHNKRIFNGSVSRVPDALFDYYQQLPGLRCLIDDLEKFNKCADNNREVYWVWKNDLKIGYVVLHKKYFSEPHLMKIRNYLEDILFLEKWYEDGTEVGYKL